MINNKEIQLINYMPDKIDKKGRKRLMGLFRCYCGNEYITRLDHVKYGVSKSCGCDRLSKLKDAIYIEYKEGEIINGFVYIGEAGVKNKRRLCSFECKYCKNTFVTSPVSIKNNHTKSCGCFKLSAIKERQTKHSMCDTSEYRSWVHMRERCHNAKNDSYGRYGAVGIFVCEEWRYSFEKFIEDMGRKPSPKHSIGRIDNEGNYEPSNCRWETPKEQNLNKRNTAFLEVEGRKHKMYDLLEKAGLSDRRKTVDARLKRGWEINRAFDYKL